MLALTPTVFIVDPDAPSRDWLRAVIRRAGWTPRTLATAGEFLAAPRFLGPSCLVLDVSVFDLGAVELLRRVAADREEAAVVRVGGNGHWSAVTAAAARRECDYGAARAGRRDGHGRRRRKARRHRSP